MVEPDPPSTDDGPAEDARTRIVEASAGLIAAGGRDAATTRAIAAAAAVQAPTIYRLFGDKRGLFDAVAEHALKQYVAEKAGLEPHPDPVQDLRDGWDMHVAFCLANPGLFAIMSTEVHDGEPSPANVAGLEVLRRRIRRIALAGRLRVSEARALALVQSAGVGTVLTLLRERPQKRDPGLSKAAREAVIAAISKDGAASVEPKPNALAAALRAALPGTSVLTSGEAHLLRELLDRIADGP